MATSSTDLKIREKEYFTENGLVDHDDLDFRAITRQRAYKSIMLLMLCGLSFLTIFDEIPGPPNASLLFVCLFRHPLLYIPVVLPFFYTSYSGWFLLLIAGLLSYKYTKMLNRAFLFVTCIVLSRRGYFPLAALVCMDLNHVDFFRCKTYLIIIIPHVIGIIAGAMTAWDIPLHSCLWILHMFMICNYSLRAIKQFTLLFPVQVHDAMKRYGITVTGPPLPMS